jgi:hypothetical protein
LYPPPADPSMLILAQAFILAVVLGTLTGANLWFSFVF